jgi:hypothetical protein
VGNRNGLSFFIIIIIFLKKKYIYIYTHTHTWLSPSLDVEVPMFKN